MKTGLRGAPLVAASDIDTPLGTMTALATAKGLAALWFDARERFADALSGVAEDERHPAIVAARRTGATGRVDDMGDLGAKGGWTGIPARRGA